MGRNNAGKSSVVEALRLLSIVTTRFTALPYCEGPDWGDIPKVEFGVRPSLKGLNINFATLFHGYGEPPAVIEATFDNETSVRIYLGGDEQIHAVVLDRKGEPIKSKAAANKLGLPIVEILPQIEPLDRNETILNEEYVRRSDSSHLYSKHFRNQIRIYAERVPQFKSIVEETWPSIQIRDLHADEWLQGNPLSLMIREDGFVGEVGSMGHGLQMWLQTMWFLARVHNGACVILDEPDVYMHPDLQRRLIRYLKQHHDQVIIATHSVEIMAEVSPDEILVVDRRRSSSGFATDTSSVQRLVDGIGSVHNLQLARLWNARKCLLVEGDDIKLLGIAHQKHFPKSESLATIPNFDLGGWGNWPYAIGSSHFLQNSGGEDITMYCVLDSDFHTIETIGKRYKDASKANVNLHIWSKKEIENYFVAPAAIIRVIENRVQNRTKLPSIEEVVDQLSKIGESLKDETFDAIVDELHSEDKSLGPGGANKLARKLLESSWQTIESRLSIVSGKRLITRLSRWTQEQFGVGLNASMIARMMTLAEFDDEMIDVISAIEEGRDFANSYQGKR